MSSERTPTTGLGAAEAAKSSHWISNLLLRSVRPPKERRIGLEVERLALWSDLTPFQYSDKPNRPGAGTLLLSLETLGWEAVNSPTGQLIGLKSMKGTVSLEPGNQLELSLAPFSTLGESVRAIDTFEEQVAKVTKPWGLEWVGLGVNPLHSVRDIELIPSPRYGIMTEHFGKTGRLGTAMMRLTTSIQVNLDYSTEQEAIDMLRTGLAASPVSYLLFANSPFFERQLTEFNSFRSQIWRDTDPSRAGFIPGVFNEGYSFQDYADFLWSRPLMFAQDPKSQFISAQGKSLLTVSKEANPLFPIDENNQWNAVREMFTEVRLKPGYVEVRNIDGELPKDRYASAAFWVGLLYGEESRKLTQRLLAPYTAEGALEKLCLEASKRDSGSLAKLWEIAGELTKSAEATLKARGHGEEKLLKPTFEILEAKRSPGAALVDKYKSEWNKKIERVIEATKF